MLPADFRIEQVAKTSEKLRGVCIRSQQANRLAERAAFLTWFLTSFSGRERYKGSACSAGYSWCAISA